MSSPLKVIKGAMHFWSSHAKSYGTPVSVPDISAQVCSAWGKARVFSCLTVWISLVLAATVWGMKSQGHSPLRQGGASHQPEVSCWAMDSLKATACHWAPSRALGSQRPSLMMWLAMDTLPLALISFHQWGCPLLSICRGGWLDLDPLLALIRVGTRINQQMVWLGH